MVAYQAPITWDAPNKPQTFSWVSLPIQSIFESGLRLEASVYATVAKQAEIAIQSNQYGCVPIYELASIHHYPRFKSVFVQKSKFPIYQPSQIGELNPSPAAYISDKTLVDLNTLRVSEGQILMTCSGTVGNVTFVSKTLAGNIFSHDLLRIVVMTNIMQVICTLISKAHRGGHLYSRIITVQSFNTLNQRIC